MTIFNTNPPSGGSGGDYDFFNDAPVGTYGAFPKSIIESQPKWLTGFTGQLIPTGTYPELDALPDFQVPETTNNVFRQGASLTSATSRGWTYAANNTMYKVKNTNPLTITQSDYDINTQLETETPYLTLTNLVDPAEFFAMSDDETKILTIGRSPANRLNYYNVSTSTVTQVTGNFDPDEVLAMRWDESNSRFELILVQTTSTVEFWTIENGVGTLQQTHSVGEAVPYFGNCSKEGTTNFTNGKYFFVTKTSSSNVYSIDNTTFSLTMEHTFPNAVANYTKGMTGFNGSLAAITDFNFTTKQAQITISLDGGVTWNEYFYTESSAPTSAVPFGVMFCGKDYLLMPHDNGTSSSKWYRISIINNNNGTVFSTTVSEDSVVFDRGCLREDGQLFYALSNDSGLVSAWQRQFSGGDGLTMPDLSFNEYPDQFIYGLKHTS